MKPGRAFIGCSVASTQHIHARPGANQSQFGFPMKHGNWSLTMLSHITATTTSSAILRARAAGRCGAVWPELNPRMIGIAIITNAVGNSHNTPNSTA